MTYRDAFTWLWTGVKTTGFNDLLIKPVANNHWSRLAGNEGITFHRLQTSVILRDINTALVISFPLLRKPTFRGVPERSSSSVDSSTPGESCRAPSIGPVGLERKSRAPLQPLSPGPQQRDPRPTAPGPPPLLPTPGLRRHETARRRRRRPSGQAAAASSAASSAAADT